MLCCSSVVWYGLPVYGAAKPKFIIRKLVTQMCDTLFQFNFDMRTSNAWGSETFFRHPKWLQPASRVVWYGFFESFLIWSSINQSGETYFRHPDFSVGVAAVPVWYVPPILFVEKLLTQMCDTVFLFSCRLGSSNVVGGETYICQRDISIGVILVHV